MCLAGLLFLFAPEVRADNDQDPPTRVARISSIDGSVSIQPGGTGEWGNAALNRPVTVGDKLWVDQNSRAELQIGEVAFHMGGMTALSFLNLDGNITQARLAEGKLNFRVREIRQGDTYEVDTPNLAFNVHEAGAFRIDVSENGDFTRVTVIRGQAEIASAGQTYTLQAGQRADVTGTDNNVKVETATAQEPDDLDRWAQERDVKEDNSVSAKYVNRDVVGYSDLDDYGTWKEEPEYGNVWVPNSVPVGWAPYSYGYWNWVGPWGWTWVDYAPWGFAPFHYGRWNYFGGYWGWCPGPIYARPFYGPAFVGFVGGFGFGFGWGGGFGWFPLGWGEPFHPWYHCGAGYWRGVNVNNTFIRNVNSVNTNSYRNFNYRYARNPNAVTVASHNAFVNGQPVNRGATHLTEASLRGAHVTAGVNAMPTHASFVGQANSRGHISTPPTSVQSRSVVARTAPAASASHLSVHTMNSANLQDGHATNAPASSARTMSATQGMSTNRQSQISSNRPPTARVQNYGSAGVNNAPRSSGSTRTWNAQGNTTDSGHAPRGFGGNNRPTTPAQTTRMNSSNRPPWARQGATSNSPSAAPYNSGNSGNRPPSSMGGNRSYTPPTYNNNRGNSAPRSYYPQADNNNRGYSAPRSYTPGPRSYNAPSYNNRSYSAPRSSSAPSPRGYSAPRSSGGGGGGGSYHGGGSGASHGGGGGGSRAHR
jgi:hypothetical protein